MIGIRKCQQPAAVSSISLTYCFSRWIFRLRKYLNRIIMRRVYDGRLSTVFNAFLPGAPHCLAFCFINVVARQPSSRRRRRRLLQSVPCRQIVSRSTNVIVDCGLHGETSWYRLSVPGCAWFGAYEWQKQMLIAASCLGFSARGRVQSFVGERRISVSVCLHTVPGAFSVPTVRDSTPEKWRVFETRAMY